MNITIDNPIVRPYRNLKFLIMEVVGFGWKKQKHL